MMLQKPDTKDIFAKALIELAKSRPIEKISVKAIVDHAGSARQTFYNHFIDKYELINWFYVVNANKIISESTNVSSWGVVIGNTLTFVYENRAFFGNAISEEGQLSFINSFYEHTEQFYINFVKTTYGEDKVTEDLLFDIRFNCHGAIAMVKDWLKNDMNQSPMEMGGKIANAMPQSLKYYMDQPIKGSPLHPVE